MIQPRTVRPLPLLTVICPVYNEEKTIPLFYERLTKVFGQLRGRYRTAVLFVDNCSEDGTFKNLILLREKDPSCYFIRLTRNFGYQCSVECGLKSAQGDIFVVIDVDCEDPPEMIADFLVHYEKGFDVVYGERVDRVENVFLKMIRKLYYRATEVVADDPFVIDMAEFCLMSADVRNAILEEMNSFPFIRSSIGRVGFKRKQIPYKRQQRVAGETHYNLIRMAVFAVAGVLTASSFPLRFPAYIFPIWIASLLGVAAGGIYWGWSWSIPALLVIGFGFVGMTLSFVSIYIARIYKNGLQRPNFVIDRKRSFTQPEI